MPGLRKETWRRLAPGLPWHLVVPPPPPPPPPPPLLSSVGRGGCVGGWRNRRWRMEEGGGGARSLVPGGPVLLVLCGLLEASGGGRALPQLSDDIPFRVNWPGTEFSLVSALAKPVAISLPPRTKGSFPSLGVLRFSPLEQSLQAHASFSSPKRHLPRVHSFIQQVFLEHVTWLCLLCQPSIGNAAVTCSPLFKSASLDLANQHSRPVEEAFLGPRQAYTFIFSLESRLQLFLH